MTLPENDATGIPVTATNPNANIVEADQVCQVNSTSEWFRHFMYYVRLNEIVATGHEAVL